MRTAQNFKELWSCLHGLLCVHKPRDVSIATLKRLLTAALCKDINECFPQKHLPLIELPIVEPHRRTEALVVVGTRKQIDYSLHPLVVGGAVVEEDIRLEELSYLEPASSGICLFGLNDGCNELESISDRVWVNEYKVMGQLGRETVNNQIRGKVVQTCDYSMVTYYNMQKLLNKVQAQYKRVAFELANVDLQSQEAFELACKGLPRPKILGTPVIYNAKISFFKQPNFLLTLHCVFETDAFLRQFIRELGVSLGSTGSCRRLLRSRLGPFDQQHALLDKHFTLQNILLNMAVCRGVLENDKKNSDRSVVTSAPQVSLSEILDDELYEPLDFSDEAGEIEDCLRIPWGRNYET